MLGFGSRHLLFLAVTLATAISGLAYYFALWPVYPLVGFGVIMAVGVKDLLQRRHAVLRNYPLLGHVRYFLELIRPEIRQYFLEADHEEVPFSRESRAIVYQRAKKSKINAPLVPKRISTEAAISGSRIRSDQIKLRIRTFVSKSVVRPVKSRMRRHFIIFQR